MVDHFKYYIRIKNNYQTDLSPYRWVQNKIRKDDWALIFRIRLMIENSIYGHMILNMHLMHFGLC